MVWSQQADSLYAQPSVDTVQHQMHDVEVKAYRITGSLRGEAFSELRWNMSMMDQLPQILSNADPLHYLQLLPSVQTNAEFDAGIHVQGCSSGQSLTMIGDAPVYNPAHLMGFFSTFNPTHYDELIFRTFNSPSLPTVLGGTIQMSPHQQPVDSLRGSLSVGLLSSQGTMRIPLHKGQSLTISARQSYINLIYGKFIRMDDSPFSYRFGDYNVSYSVERGRHQLALNGFYSLDNGGFGNRSKDVMMKARWQNYVAMATLDSKPRSVIDAVHQSLYLSGYDSRVSVEQTKLEGTMPSYVHTLGYSLLLTQSIERRRQHELRYGADLQQHFVRPQSPEINTTYNLSLQNVARQCATQGALFGEYAVRFSPIFSLKPGVRFNLYALWNDSAKTYAHVDPYLTMTFASRRAGMFNVRLNTQHQYLHQAGFSSIGLPTEFRFSSSAVYKPQSALSLSLGYDCELFSRRYRIKAEVYGKLLDNQTEYHGDLLSFYTTGYSMETSLVSGRGYNYGINLQLIKQTGQLTGWISYAYNRSMRQFDMFGPDRWYPSNYERPHELNVVLTYKLRRHWSFGGTYVFASGTPFTAVKYGYLLSNNLIAEYGEHNANRLAPYSRLDVSATYEFLARRSRVKHGLNLSVYNTLYNRNEVYCRMKIYKGEYYYQPTTFLIVTLPSLSYYIKF